MSSSSGRTSGSARELGERPDAALERLDFADHDLDRLVHERPLRGRLSRLHFLDREPDRRQRVLQFVRGLPRQRLPARHSRQVHQTLSALLELIRHVVERVDGARHFVPRRNARPLTRLQPPRPVAPGKIGERFGELLDRPADAMRDEHQRQQRQRPGRTEEQEQRQRESAPQIPRIDGVDELTGLSKLGGQLFHADAAQITAVDVDPRRTIRGVDPPHVVHALAASTGYAEALGLTALPERSDRLRPPRGVRCRVGRGAHPPGEAVVLQRRAFALVELFGGVLERPGQSIELARRRIAEAAIEERRRDPDGGAERHQGRGEERGDQPGAQTGHRVDGIDGEPRGGSLNGPASRACIDDSVLRRRLNASIRACSV